MEVQASSKTRTNIILINNGQKTNDTHAQQQTSGQAAKVPPTNILPSNPGAIGGISNMRPQFNSIILLHLEIAYLVIAYCSLS